MSNRSSMPEISAHQLGSVELCAGVDQSARADELYRQTGQIARQLGEVEAHPRMLIKRALRLLGYARVQSLVDQAMAIEAAGGEWLHRQQRRRTLGGIFFRLLPDQLSEDEQRALGLVRDWRAERERQRRQPPPADPFDVSHDWLSDVLNDAGALETMDVQLIGKPGKTIEHAGVVIAAFDRTQQLTLPRGLPALPQGHGRYLIFVAKRQWDRLGELAPDDTLVVKGYATLHPKFSQGICLYVEAIAKKVPAPAASRFQERSP